MKYISIKLKYNFKTITRLSKLFKTLLNFQAILPDVSNLNYTPCFNRNNCVVITSYIELPCYNKLLVKCTINLQSKEANLSNKVLLQKPWFFYSRIKTHGGMLMKQEISKKLFSNKSSACATVYSYHLNFMKRVGAQIVK